MTEMYFCLLRMGISEESIWKLCSLPYAIWFLWNLSRIFNGMPHCSIIPLIRARENGSAMACVNLWLKPLRLSLSCRHPHPFLHPFHSLCTHPLHPLFFLLSLFLRLVSSFGFFVSLRSRAFSYNLFLSCSQQHTGLYVLPRCPLSCKAAVCTLWSIVCAFRPEHLNTFLSRLRRFRFLLSFFNKTR